MAESDKLSIPPDLASAFHDAVVLLKNWFGGPEPLVSFNRQPWTISSICGLVTSFEDLVPDDIQHVLLRTRVELPPKLPITYAAAGRACVKEIAARKARYEGSKNL
jgi:hypothetical protein